MTNFCENEQAPGLLDISCWFRLSWNAKIGVHLLPSDFVVQFDEADFNYGKDNGSFSFFFCSSLVYLKTKVLPPTVGLPGCILFGIFLTELCVSLQIFRLVDFRACQVFTFPGFSVLNKF